MATRTCGVDTLGMAIKFDEMKNLIIKNYASILVALDENIFENNINDDVVIIELQKNTLYEKYNNKNEIIDELKNTLKEVGIIVDDEFIENHYGIINGSYYS